VLVSGVLATVALAISGVTANPDTLSFPDTDAGVVGPTMSSTVTNHGTAATITSVDVTGNTADFQILTGGGGDCSDTASLADNGSCTVRVQFQPQTTGGKSVVITVHTSNGDPTITASGTATARGLTGSPDPLAFGNVNVGASSSQTSTITNTGSNPIDLSTPTIGGPDASQYAFASPAAPSDCDSSDSLAAGGSCNVRVVFQPTTTGAKTAHVTLPSSNASDSTVGLTGTGTQPVLSKNHDLSFGGQDIDDGPTASQTSVVTNTGDGPATISSVGLGGTDAGDFTLDSSAGTDCKNGTVLAPTATCDVRVAFDPGSIGSKNATVDVTSDAAPLSIALDGTGEQTAVTPDHATLAFGGQDIDDGPVTPDQTVTFTNSGPKTVAIDGVTVSSGQGFTRNGGSCVAGTTTLAPSNSCTVTVRFDPSTTGAKTGTVTVTSPDAFAASADLTGAGEQTTITPDNATLDFGSQDVNAGPTSTQTATITNSGPKTVNLSSVALTGSQRAQFFRLTDQPATDCAAGTTLAANATCEVRVRFDPSYEGPKSATVAITTPDADPASIALVGTAGQASFPRSDVPLDSFEFDGPVNAVAFDSAGRTYVGGAFTSIGRRTGRGVKLTTADDQPAAGFPDVDGPINAVAADGSGGWFIGGSFATVGGVPRPNLAHILSSGAVDPGWNPAPDSTVNALVRVGTELYVGGDFTHMSGQSSIRLGRVTTSNGTLDTNWTPDPNSTVTAITVSGSDVYVGGNFALIGGAARDRLTRLDAGLGETDTTWTPGSVNGLVNSIAVDGSGVYVGGAFTQVGATTRNRVAKLALAGGALDPTWNPNANGVVNTLALDGTDVYAGGAFTNIGTQARNRIARLAESGSGDADGWNPNASAAVNDLVVSGSNVYTAGAFTQIGGQPRNRIARLSTSTGLADSWNPNANGTANAIAIDGSNVFVGGSFTSVGGQTARSRIARLLPDGTVDPDWDPGSNNTVNALLVSGSDVYAGGQFTSIGGQSRNRLARLTTADGGAADALWNPDVGNGTVNSLTLSGTSLFVGGGFTTISTQTHNRIAKVPTTGAGTADSGWTASASGSVLALATDGTSVYAGGTFITMNGPPTGNRPFIAKLAAADGTLDPNWNPSANSVVRALALSGSSLFVGGDFTSIGGQTRNGLAKLSAGPSPDTGTADIAWDPNANSVVRALVIAGTDIYAGGDFTLVGGASHNNVVRLPTGDGGAHDSGWNPIANGTVSALAATSTRLAAGGAFTTVHSQSRQGVALFDLPRLSRNPSGHQFGSQDTGDGATAAQTTAVTNTGAVPLTFSSLTLTGPDAGEFVLLAGGMNDCTPTTTLNPGDSCNVRVQFDPSTTGIKSAWIDIQAPSTPDATIGLAGTGTHTELTRAPSSLSFGAQDIDNGPAADQESTVTNSGSVPITVNDVLISGTDTADFTHLSGEPTDCFDGRTLNAGQTCKVRLEFDPTTTGTKTATATVQSDAGDVPIALDGSGIQTELSRSPATLAFGKQDIDDAATAAQSSTVTNTGTEPVTFTGISATGDAGDFTRLTGAGDCTSTTTLTAGQSCTLSYTFDPTTVGAKSATVTVASNAANISVALTGEGTQTQLTPAPTSLSFGSKDINAGATPAMTSTVTNSGTEPVTVSGVALTGDFAQVTGNVDDCVATTVLTAGQNCKLRITFDPSAVHARSGTATVQSNAPDAVVSLDGTGTQTSLSRSPSSLSFGDKDIDEGPTPAQDVTVTNSGTQSITLNNLAATGDFAIVSGAGTNCTSSTTLTEGQSCEVWVRFDPGTTGTKSETLTISSNEVPDLTVSLSGRGTQTELSRSPATLAFGGQDVDSGPTTTQTSVVTNSGSEPVNISSVTFGGSDPGEFVRPTIVGTDCTSSTVLTAGQTCDVRIQFDPSTQGAKSATVSVASNAATITVDLTGTGKQTKLDRSPTSLAFGSKDIDDNATAEQFSTVTNVGTEDVSIGSVGIIGADAGDFVRLTGQVSDCSGTTTLSAGQTCKVRVEFNPGSVGAKSATARVSANGVDQDVALSGTGIQTELSRSPATLSFGNKDIDDGATPAMTSTVTNSGTEGVTISSVDVTGDFAQATGNGDDCVASTVLTAGQTCKLRVTFNPSATGSRTGTATVHSNAADISVALDGTGIQTSASIAPGTLSFGNQDIDNSATAAQESTVTNTGTEPVHLTGVSLGGANPGQFNRLTGQGTDCTSSTTLNAGDTCKVRVEFDPDSTGSKSATAVVSSTELPDLTAALSGTGIQTELSRAPVSLSFGNKDIDEGATASQFSTVTNTGTEDVTITGVGVTGDFAQVTGDSADCVNGKLLHAGETCKVRVTFDPSATGARSGAATVQSNAADVSVALDGNGIQTSASIAPGTLSFGSKDIDNGATASQDVTVTNTGTEPVHLTGVSLGGTDPGQFNRLTGQGTDCSSSSTLNAGDTCKVRVAFDPGSVGSKSATVTVSSTELLDMTVALSGTGIQTELSRSPASRSFGPKDIDEGATAEQFSTVTNSGTEDVTITGVVLSGDFAQVTGDTADCVNGKLLHATDTCKVRVTFDPSATGSRTGSATVQSNAADIAVALDGTGIQTSASIAPSTLSFGNQDIDNGATASQDVTVTNTGTEPVHLTGVSLGGTNPGQFNRLTGQGADCPKTLNVGDTCKVRVTFDPDSTGSKSATLTVSSTELADLTASVSGTGIQTELTPAPATLSFGSKDIDEGATPERVVVITNSGSEGVTVSGVVVTGDFAQVTGNVDDCVASTVLAAGQTCKLRITFDPTATGARTGTATVNSNSVPISVSLSGTGTQTLLSAAPPTLALGSQDVDDGPTASQTSTITNVGSLPVTLTGVNVSGGDFAQVTGAASDCANGTTLAAGQTCEVRVRFDPGSVGAQTGSVTVTSNAADVTIALSGTGIQTTLSRSPNALDFGARNVAAGATPDQSLTLTNSGTQPITLSDVSLIGTNPSQFQRVSGAATDCAASVVLAAGDTCAIRVRFAPTSAGPKAAAVTVASSAGADIVIPLSGTGTPAPKLTIPAFRALARSTAHKRLKVAVVPVGGTIKTIVVEIRTPRGKLLGTGRLASASTKRTVTITLKHALVPGGYVAKGRGKDAFGHTVTVTRNFQITLRNARPTTGGGGGVPTGGGSG
jgi:hypothetical protein